jgi:acetyl esterase/lipase/NRPS condensation-like uncharacterized protein
MAPTAKTIRNQMNMLQPLLKNCSLETIRRGQNRVGELMEGKYRRQVHVREHQFDHFDGAWIIPRDQRREGVILYLHGGGYVCGNLEYAKGFGSMLTCQTGNRVFCAAYRLAPEHPFPAAVEDALEAYRYLLSKGYGPEHITLCGESAGGGLCYSLCMKLKELGMKLPCGIIAISPWVDLTGSGDSYEYNRERDPSLTKPLLDAFGAFYSADRLNPLVSPLFGDLRDMPPSLIFAGGDEILLSDAENLHEKLCSCGGKSILNVKPDRWHAYILYGIGEDQPVFSEINAFLNRHMAPADRLRWMPLDNAAKIYPAARNQNWSNVFRLSATLKEEIDPAVMQTALDVTVRRFPSMATRLRRGVFWYYLQQLDHAPSIREEHSYPLTRMSRDETRQCALRVIVHRRRVAVEIFHSLTDGNGGMVFLKTLVAEYLRQKYGVLIPAEQGVLGRLEEPTEEELEDSFQKHAGPVQASRKGTNAFKPVGTPEPDGFLHVTCFELPVREVLEKAKGMGVSLTAFLCAVTMRALLNLQQEQVPDRRRRKHIKVLIPVNLRSMFGSRTMRNFVLYTTPEIDPRLGEYTFEELCQRVKHQMALEINPKYMGSLIATNVSSERIWPVKVVPLFVKNLIMKAVFNAVGERKSCLSLSNLGAVKMPRQMQEYVERMDFILGVQNASPYNCGVLSVGDTLYVNFIRNIREPELEYHYHRALQELGLTAQVRSNGNE